MLKTVTLQLMILSMFFISVPLQSISFAQDDELFEAEADDFSDDMLEEDVMEQPAPASTSEKKESKKEEKVTSSKNETPLADKKDKKDKKGKKQDIIENPSVEMQVEAPQPPPVAKPAPVILTPVESKPKAAFAPITAPEQNIKAGTTVKRSGPPLVLIARPVYAPYSDESKTMYIAATSEAYFHFKLGSLPGISVIPIDRVSNNIQYFRDFSRRISATAYKETAKKMGAAFLLYSEYQPNGKKVKFATELYSIADNKKIAGSTSDIDLAKFEDGLFDCAIEVAGALIGTIPKESQEFLAAPVFGNKGDELGQAIAAVGEFNKKRTATFIAQFDKLAKDNSNHLAKFVAADICALGGQLDKSISFIQQLNASFGDQYPALMLRLAQYHRLAKSYDEALSAAQQAGNTPTLKHPAQIEKARIYEAQGNLQDAKREYESVLNAGEDGDILFQLALVSIGLNDLSKAERYLEQASAAGRTFDRGDYFDLGLRYEAIGSANEQAITAFRNCLGLQQDNTEAWQKLSELYALSGREAEAAECYVSLFQIDNNLYKDYLIKAGTLFENGGYFDNAKDVYELYIGRRFDSPEVRVRLAKLEMQSGNCPKAVELVDEMDTTGPMGQDIVMINTQCQKQERRVVIPTETGNKGWKAVFFWRVASGVIAVGGVAAGYAFDQQIPSKQEAYSTSKGYTDPSIPVAIRMAEIKRLHDDLAEVEKMRNLSYLGAGIGIASLGISIVIPIVLQ